MVFGIVMLAIHKTMRKCFVNLKNYCFTLFDIFKFDCILLDTFFSKSLDYELPSSKRKKKEELPCTDMDIYN